MHKRFSGFTLIELMVAVAVIVIIATIGILGYENVLKDSHDTKRRSDITALQQTLEKYYEKNGEYPAGCGASSCSIGGNSSMFNTSAVTSLNPSGVIGSNTTRQQLRSVLPGLDDNFGDPLDQGDKPLFDQNGNSDNGTAYRYLYFGGIRNKTSTPRTYEYQMQGSYFACKLSVYLEAGQASNYIVGYFSEQPNKKAGTPEQDRWHILHGAHGKQFALPNTPDGLFCNNGTAITGGSIDN